MHNPKLFVCSFYQSKCFIQTSFNILIKNNILACTGMMPKRIFKNKYENINFVIHLAADIIL